MKAPRTISTLRATEGQPPVPFRGSNKTPLRTPQGQVQHASAARASLMSLQSGQNSGDASSATDTPPTMPFPSPDAVAQSELLQDSVFPTWKEESGPDTIETPEELQKQDPLGTQIWKLYSRTKTRLPNQERMENLTWRMMAMNLKRREREQQAAAL